MYIYIYILYILYNIVYYNILNIYIPGIYIYLYIYIYTHRYPTETDRCLREVAAQNRFHCTTTCTTSHVTLSHDLICHPTYPTRVLPADVHPLELHLHVIVVSQGVYNRCGGRLQTGLMELFWRLLDPRTVTTDPRTVTTDPRTVTTYPRTVTTANI